jgi:hypothetical protein
MSQPKVEALGAAWPCFGLVTNGSGSSGAFFPMGGANGTTHEQLHVTDRTQPERSHRTGAHHATGNDSPPPRHSRAPALR